MWKSFNMTYLSTHSDEYMWRLILRGKQQRKKQINTKFLFIFNGRNEHYF